MRTRVFCDQKKSMVKTEERPLQQGHGQVFEFFKSSQKLEHHIITIFQLGRGQEFVTFRSGIP